MRPAARPTCRSQPTVYCTVPVVRSFGAAHCRAAAAVPKREGTSQMHHAGDWSAVLRNLPAVVTHRVPSAATSVSGRSFCVTTLRANAGALSPLRSGMAHPASNATANDAKRRADMTSILTAGGRMQRCGLTSIDQPTRREVLRRRLRLLPAAIQRAAHSR